MFRQRRRVPLGNKRPKKVQKSLEKNINKSTINTFKYTKDENRSTAQEMLKEIFQTEGKYHQMEISIYIN